MFNTSNFSKYILYALGEIILVVIGILLALQINNWNEEKKAAKKEHIYLRAIYSDLKTNDAEFERVLNKTNRVANASFRLLKLKDSLPNQWNSSVFDSLIKKSAGYTVLMIDEGAINDINGSGNLSLIKNDSIREKIASWDANLSMLREYETLFKEAVFNFKELSQNYLNLSGDRYKNEALLNTEDRNKFYTNKYLNNSIFEVVTKAFTLMKFYEEERKVMQKFQIQIKTELENFEP